MATANPFVSFCPLLGNQSVGGFFCFLFPFLDPVFFSGAAVIPGVLLLPQDTRWSQKSKIAYTWAMLIVQHPLILCIKCKSLIL